MGKSPNMLCNLCGATATSRKRIRLHARLHYVHSFCKCGYASKWRESIRSHQKDTRNSCSDQTPVYEVDAASFASWKRTLGVAIDTYPGEIPTRIITGSTQPAATSALSLHLQLLRLALPLVPKPGPPKKSVEWTPAPPAPLVPPALQLRPRLPPGGENTIVETKAPRAALPLITLAPELSLDPASLSHVDLTLASYPTESRQSPPRPLATRPQQESTAHLLPPTSPPVQGITGMPRRHLPLNLHLLLVAALPQRRLHRIPLGRGRDWTVPEAPAKPGTRPPTS